MSAVEAAALVRAVSADGLDSDAIRERFARAAWTVVAEPGDGDAGDLVRALGAHAAWRLVVDRADAAAVAEAAAAAGLDGGTAAWVDAVKRWRSRADPAPVMLALRQGARFGMRLLVPGDDHWPVTVDDLQRHAPPALWVRGDPALLAQLERSAAIVGARAATGYGEHVAIELASGLVDRGFAIVSGAAYGIDGAAHRAALASRGVTVAVLAGGLDRFYPAGHEQLIGRIVDRGVVVSEVPPGTAPTRWRFLQRNRIIAALSCATVVVEAGWRSGALNTASHAGTLGRPIGAVPGPITSAASAGCHKLLRDSTALCVTTADEIVELAGAGLAPRPVDPDDEHRADPEGTRGRVLDALSDRSPRRTDRIAVLSGLALDRVRAELGLLELDGRAIERPAGWVKRKG
ncbi:MAG TPA: DNA-processing protein DprA [Pseudolysinimonas sp.]|nr:DNA-processing protein DprA [Pseudolysinimonas sp.]